MPAAIELTILMPCLNEARTLATCVDQARHFLDTAGIAGEVLVADNGSTDGSVQIARDCGARVIQVTHRGYGSALRAGIQAARGRFVIMGDSDCSYDFGHLESFVEALRSGQDLVVGNRFRGGIAEGAMPPLHRYLGNPVLSFIGRRFFGGSLHDFHCGLRGFRRQAMVDLHLVTPGMEFASEMIVKALQAGLHVVEVPTMLSKDGRNRPPHLNTWRDGWRHLRYLFLYAPRWLFLYPGAGLFLLGLLQLLLCVWEPPMVAGWPTGIHTQLYAVAACILGWQTVMFALGALWARHCAGLDTPHPRERFGLSLVQGPWLLPIGVVGLGLGLILCVGLTWDWHRGGLGALDPEVAMRKLIPGIALTVLGSQCLLAKLFLAAVRSAFDSSRASIGAVSAWTEVAE